MKTIRIGYQGDPGSNAEAAARIFADKLVVENGDAWIKFVPLTTAENVFTALKDDKISLGVVAVVNSLGGVVSETRNMLEHAGIEKWKISSIDEHTLPIHHCLFSKHEDCEIAAIASHEQALKQTVGYRKGVYPDARAVVTIDTAYAAQMLAEGDFSDEVAVICTKEAGELHELFLVDENIEDSRSYTVFHLLQGDFAAENNTEEEMATEITVEENDTDE